MTDDDKEKHHKKLKEYVDPIVRDCISKNYSIGAPFGYLIMVGGEALNYYLPEDKKVPTSDYDLKFVVTPKFTNDDENLKKANLRRLYILNNMINCLSNIKPPKGYTKLYPHMTLLVKDKIRKMVIEGNKIYTIDEETGEKDNFYYRYNKIFTIKLAYQYKDEPLNDFTLVDIGLYYRLPEEEPYYNFMTSKIYDTFLQKPFYKTLPMPFEVHNNIRIPILPYILVDNFRMILFAYDFMTVYEGNEEKIAFFTKKLAGYEKKMKIILDEYKKNDELCNRRGSSGRDIRIILNDVISSINDSIALYRPLAPLNALCYREKGKTNYIKILQSHKECDKKYIRDLEYFYSIYQKTLKFISELMPCHKFQPKTTFKPKFNLNKNLKSKSRSKSRSKSKSKSKKC